LELAMRVEAARGAMAVDGLGTTLMHEHVFVLTPDVMQDYGHEWRWDEQDRGADAVRRLHGLKDAGVGSVVDPTVVDLARYIPPAQLANEQVDINIIGLLLGMDCFGIDVFLPFEDRVTTVAALAKAGYADRMVLSHDASCYSESYKTALLPRWNYPHHR
jgi:predicted metal-dependent phosphotriesterase family hydrolase